MTGHDPTPPGPPRPDPRRPLTWADSPEEQALIAPWNAGHGAPLADVQHAAELNNDAAQHALAYRYDPRRRAATAEHGDGVPLDVATAARKFRASAERGYAGGQGNIGHAYAYGLGVDQDDAQALHWLQLAAHDGRRTTGLAYLYDTGRGVPQDFAQAARLYRIAADKSHPTARSNLGLMHLRGDGVPQDFPQAARLFRLAAEQGYAKAQLYLADAYHHGDGVDKNPAEAEQWYRRAAEQGNGLARLLLESRYPTDETHS